MTFQSFVLGGDRVLGVVVEATNDGEGGGGVIDGGGDGILFLDRIR